MKRRDLEIHGRERLCRSKKEVKMKDICAVSTPLAEGGKGTGRIVVIHNLIGYNPIFDTLYSEKQP